MSALVQEIWIPENRKTTVCADSYSEGILQGRFYGPDGEERPFGSLSQFFVMMEEMLEYSNAPQSSTTARSFSSLLLNTAALPSGNGIRTGAMATFELQILFRRHTSWQGLVLWKEQGREQPFRSVLELILLLDSALRSPEGRQMEAFQNRLKNFSENRK